MATPSVTDEITGALQQFQAALSPEQKVQFSTSQSSTPSDVNGVLAFTAEVDALKQRRQARCFGSRLQSTLQSVQQFTSIVSTFVNSNPAVAALVWGSIRFTVLVASNWSSFFEKLTTWFMQMQACCPRFSDYQLLYPESTKLQEVLCSFYACLIRFCTKALATVNDTGKRFCRRLSSRRVSILWLCRVRLVKLLFDARFVLTSICGPFRDAVSQTHSF